MGKKNKKKIDDNHILYECKFTNCVEKFITMNDMIKHYNSHFIISFGVEYTLNDCPVIKRKTNYVICPYKNCRANVHQDQMAEHLMRCESNKYSLG